MRGDFRKKIKMFFVVFSVPLYAESKIGIGICIGLVASMALRPGR
jgi:hypothetical protein